MELIRIIASILAILLGSVLLYKVWKKHQLIDTESIAVVKEVISLGRSDGKKVYAIKYDVQAKEPFELLVTPCKKALKPGKKRGVFYEKANPNKNNYFKTIGQFDKRLVVPVFTILIGVVLFAITIVEMIVA
jgi:hypothetical protein